MKRRWVSLACCSSQFLFALPSSPQILEGAAQFLSAESELAIRVDRETSISWSDFSIDTGETVVFQQPSVDSIVLNRVIGERESLILGRLKANGQVLLVNGNGVLFGKESRIDVGSFLASTLDCREGRFEGDSNSSIVNEGVIEARSGSIRLIASDLNNRGSLIAAQSAALIGSGHRSEIECRFFHSGSRIFQSGRIAAKEGPVHLTADELYFFNGSSIEGREILAGGGLKGEDPAFANATICWVGEGAEFKADDFGRVILFSKGTTDFSGSITARGGFAEVSGSMLSFNGHVDLRFDEGQIGTLLLDPLDVTIGGADMNISTTPGFPSFPFNCSGTNCQGASCAGSSLSSTQIAPTGSPSFISTATLLGLLMAAPCANVVIDTTGAGGGSGNITWLAGSNLAYFTTCDLVLRAPSTGVVSIRSNVQNAGTGRVIIDSLGPLVEINAAGATQNVSFGSQNGLTEICAPNAIVNVQSIGGFIAQVGYFIPNGAPAISGPIRVCCADLNVLATPLSVLGGAQVGHGQINGAVDVSASSDIDVIASNTINIISGGPASIQSNAKIGHGTNSSSAAMNSVYSGTIRVQAGSGSAVTPAIRMFGSGQCAGVIGHGICINGTLSSLAGDIFVQAPNGSILMESNSPTGGAIPCIIGHGSTVGVTTTSLSGSVYVCCRGDLTISDLDANLLGSIGIGHALGAGPATYTGNTQITVGGNINVFAGPPLGPSLGANIHLGTIIPAGVLSTQTTQVICGGDFTASLNSKFFFVGYVSSVAASMTNTYIAVGRNFTVLSTNGSTRVWADQDLAIAVGGSFTATSGLGGFANVFTTVNNFAAGRPNDTRIYAGGNILGINGPSVRTILGDPAFFGNPNYNVDFRAGGDIRLPNSFGAATTGSIFLEADTILPQGALWDYGGGVITSICGIPTIPILCTPSCPSPLTGRITGAPSPPIAPNGIGCFSAVTAPFPLALPLQFITTTGNITLHSAPRSALLAGNCDLNIGPFGDVILSTLSGDIDVSGSFCGNEFHDITIDQSIVTTGSVLIAANNDLIMTASGSIDTSGGPNSVTLVCDNQFPMPFLFGPGSFTMDPAAFIATGGEPLCIHTSQQGRNSISGMLNGMPFMPATQLYVDTNEEVWCFWYCDPRTSISCLPFTVTYKDGCPVTPPEVPPIVMQFLVDLHPYNEFPGWMMRFWIDARVDWIEENQLVWTPDPEPYMMRRRNLNVINHPKTWTTLIPEERRVSNGRE